MEASLGRYNGDSLETLPGNQRSHPHFRTKKHHSTYTNDEQSLKKKLQLLFQLAAKVIQTRNKGFWANCCSTLIRNVDHLTLGHPVDSVQRIKDLFDHHRLHTEHQFIEYMLNNLPRNDHGHILVPEVNMEHPGNEHPVKHEEMSEDEAPRTSQNNIVVKLESLEREVTDQKQLINQVLTLQASVQQLIEANRSLQATVKVATDHIGTRHCHKRPQVSPCAVRRWQKGTQQSLDAVQRRLREDGRQGRGSFLPSRQEH